MKNKNSITNFINSNTTYVLYFVLIIIINILLGIFSSRVRVDVTENGAYTLSPVSRSAVENLTDQLTIKYFYDQNLTADYRSTKIYLEELLAEYNQIGGKKVVIKSYDCTPVEKKTDDKKKSKTEENIEIASSYRIMPKVIQKLETSKQTKVKVTFGLAIESGDIKETIPFIDSEAGLEYKITSVIEKINNKISTFAKLSKNNEKVRIELFLSDDLKRASISPQVPIEGLDNIEASITAAFESCNERAFNTLAFSKINDFSDTNSLKLAEKYAINIMQWPKITLPNGETVNAGKGSASLVISYDKKLSDGTVTNVYETIELIQEQIDFDPQRGLVRKYKTISGESIEDFINFQIDNVLDINNKIAYLTDKGTVTIDTPQNNNPYQQQQQQKAEAGYFNSLLSEHYTVEKVNAAELTVKDANTLIIAGPTEQFTEWELYKIDQYLMAGKNLVIFLDALKQTPQQGYYGRPTVSFVPQLTGLEKLLRHYGVQVKPAMVLDDRCVEPPQGNPDKAYWIPTIKGDSINGDFSILANIKEILNFLPSPVEIVSNNFDDKKLTATPLFSSSSRAWLLENNITAQSLQYASVPKEVSNLHKYVEAYFIEGQFSSYFADKDIPINDAEISNKSGNINKGIISSETIIKKSKPAKIFITGNSMLIKDQLFQTAVGMMLSEKNNSSLVMNVVDYANGKKDWALLRTKAQKYRPLTEDDPDASLIKKIFTYNDFLKYYNIILIPILIILLGLFIFFYDKKRKKTIQIKYLEMQK